MEIRQLLYFTAIAEEGTISGAARRLHLSQPPLSRQLQLLEEELGCQLFRRDTRHMELTEAGELLYARSRESLRSLGDIKREVADISLGKGGKLSLGVVSSVSGRLLPGWLRQFHELYPDIRIDLKEGDSYGILEQVRKQQIDIALARKPFAVRGLELTELKTEPMCAVGARSFFGDIRGEECCLGELKGKPLIIYHRWEDVLREEDAPDPFIRCEDARTTAGLASNGLGIGIVPLSAVPEDGSELEIKRLSDSFLQSAICAVRLRGRYIPAAARLFLDMLENESGQMKS